MDHIDWRILDILQRDASVTVAEIAARVGLSQTPCWKRIQKLETTGVISRRVALVDREKVGLGLGVYITIKARDHSPNSIDHFIRSVEAMPEVLELSRISGEADYVLRVVVPDVSSYDAFYQRLTAVVPLRSVVAHFILQQIKSTTALPLPFTVAAKEAKTSSHEFRPVFEALPVR